MICILMDRFNTNDCSYFYTVRHKDRNIYKTIIPNIIYTLKTYSRKLTYIVMQYQWVCHSISMTLSYDIDGIAEQA